MDIQRDPIVLHTSQQPRLSRLDVFNHLKKYKIDFHELFQPIYVELLCDYLDDEFCKHNQQSETPYFTKVIRRNCSVPVKVAKNVYRRNLTIRGSGSYFTDREVITYDPIDNSLTFANNADNKNIQPILKAFIRFIDYFELTPLRT